MCEVASYAILPFSYPFLFGIFFSWMITSGYSGVGRFLVWGGGGGGGVWLMRKFKYRVHVFFL